MGLIEQLPIILEAGRATYERLKSEPLIRGFTVSEVIRDDRNILVGCDNLNYMRSLLQKGMEGTLDLIYIDPPFFSKSNYVIDVKVGGAKEKITLTKHTAFTDRWADGMEEYLEMMVVRLYFMKALLAETGSIFVHIDWHSAHYIKVLMDAIWGEENFINEIIWNYKSGGVSKRYFARKHDTILFYSKSKHYFFQMQKEKSYNRELKPYRFKGVKEYKDDTGWYTLVSMKDVWQIDMVGRSSGERTGYATQKPEALIERILMSATKEGDLCADFFCGSGTLGVAAAKLGRRFILCDSGDAAIVKAHKRLAQQNIPHSLLWEQRPERGTHTQNLKINVEKIEHDDLAGSTTVRLKKISYSKMGELCIDSQNEEVLKRILKKDFAQLIEYWCVDPDYDGKTMHPKTYFCKDKEPVPLETLLLMKGTGRLAVKVMDVFGNEAICLT